MIKCILTWDRPDWEGIYLIEESLPVYQDIINWVKNNCPKNKVNLHWVNYNPDQSSTKYISSIIFKNSLEYSFFKLVFEGKYQNEKCFIRMRTPDDFM